MRISDWSSDVCSSDLVLAAHEVHERAEIDDVDDLAVVNLADFGLFDDALDPDARRLDLADVGRGDLDHALVIDVDLGAGGGDDLADHLAAGAEDRKSVGSGKSVSVRVDPAGRHIMK